MAKVIPESAYHRSFFGWSLDIHNGVLAVGAKDADSVGLDSGTAYLFDLSTGTQIAELIPNDLGWGDEFGYSVALDDDTVVVGALKGRNDGSRTGAVYVFDVSTGEQRAKLGVPGRSGDRFGVDVATENGIVVVGAEHYRDQYFNLPSGEVFVSDAESGSLMHNLVPTTDREVGARFGRSVDLNGGVLAVGSHSDDYQGGGTGSAYLFDINTGNQLAKLVPSIGAEEDRFGADVAIRSSDVVVMSTRFVKNTPGQSSGYVFNIEYLCLVDMTQDHLLNFLDVSMFLDRFAAGSFTTDFYLDGEINFLDVSEFLTQFAAGCP